jgi:hypothetical protein
MPAKSAVEQVVKRCPVIKISQLVLPVEQIGTHAVNFFQTYMNTGSFHFPDVDFHAIPLQIIHHASHFRRMASEDV